MSIKAVLFDLDGTLLPMDQEIFTKSYFGKLSARMAHLGYEPRHFIKTIWECTAQMIANDGSRTNGEVFWDGFCKVYGEGARAHDVELDSFYRTDFQAVKADCGFDPDAARAVRAIKAQGMQVIVATNPFFPNVATESRIRWAGMEPEDFELFTTFENYHHCKPNPAYYLELLDKLNLRPEECLMVGNDASEDLAAEQAGIRVFLLPRYLVNRKGRDISDIPQGDFKDLLNYLDTL